MSDYTPEIDQLAQDYWRAKSADRQTEIQKNAKRLGYSLKEWTDALKRNRGDR